MNPYAMLTSGSDAASPALASRLAEWHDAMVAHERRLGMRTGEVCHDECPHVEARALWVEALTACGERAHELTFLRSSAMGAPAPAGKTMPNTRRQRQDAIIVVAAARVQRVARGQGAEEDPCLT